MRLILCVLLLAGCASRAVYVHPSATQSQAHHDLYQCQRENPAVNAAHAGHYGYTGRGDNLGTALNQGAQFGSAITRNRLLAGQVEQQRAMLHNCMAARGYTLTSAQSGE